MSVPIKPFKPLSDGYGIQPIGPSPLGKGDMHDTFQVTKDGDILDGHTTIQLPGYKPKRLAWDRDEK